MSVSKEFAERLDAQFEHTKEEGTSMYRKRVDEINEELAAKNKLPPQTEE